MQESYDLNNSVNSDSSEETYIDINDILKSQMKNIYQIQPDNNNLIIKHIGTGSHVPDIIIKESFGKKNNLNLYNCVYLEDEIEFLRTEQNNDILLPVIKLIEKLDEQTNIYSLSVKINNFTNYGDNISNFSIYLTYSTTKEIYYHTELEKNINQNNIIELMLEKIIDFGFDIL